MASQLFKMEKKIDTISSDNIREIFKLIHVPSVSLGALPTGCGKLLECIVRNSSPVVLTSLLACLWKEEAASFIFDPCMEKPYPARGKKKLNFLLDKKVQKETGKYDA